MSELNATLTSAAAVRAVGQSRGAVVLVGPVDKGFEFTAAHRQVAGLAGAHSDAAHSYAAALQAPPRVDAGSGSDHKNLDRKSIAMFATTAKWESPPRSDQLRY